MFTDFNLQSIPTDSFLFIMSLGLLTGLVFESTIIIPITCIVGYFFTDILLSNETKNQNENLNQEYPSILDLDEKKIKKMKIFINSFVVGVILSKFSFQSLAIGIIFNIVIKRKSFNISLEHTKDACNQFYNYLIKKMFINGK